MPSIYSLSSPDRCLVIAHRGASAYYPENTLAAFHGAVKMGAEMVELDVMLSRDGVPVVFHDARLNAHTNGKGLLQDYALRDLRKLDAGSWFDPVFSEETIPTLEEALAFAAGKVALNIEIKPEAVAPDAGIVDKCLELVQAYDMQDHVLFSSFDYRAISRIKQQDPGMPTALLYERKQSQRRLPYYLLEAYNADAFNCSYHQLTSNRLAHLRRHRIPTFVYTVNDRRRMRKLLKHGVTGIFTNRPDVLKELVGDTNARPFSAG